MKIWIKYIIGVILGIIFALLAGSENQLFIESTKIISQLAVQIGRYSLYPLLFFGFAVGVYNLSESKRLWRLIAFFVIFSFGTTLLLSLIGVISIWIGNPSRIPIFVEEAVRVPSIKVSEFFLQAFPSSPFEAFINPNFIFPLCLLGGFVGMGTATIEKHFSKYAFNLFDSLARIGYAIMSLFVEIFAVFLIAISAFWLYKFRSMLASNFFTDFIILLSVDMLIVVCGIYPLIIKIICKDVNPYKVIYACLASMAVAIFLGDTNATLPITIKHIHESLGVRRRVSNVLTPLFAVFANAGSAMTLTMSFMIIFKSYSSQGMNIKSIIWLVLISTFVSFFMSRFPQGGVYVALATICAMYGSGYEAGYLILKPAAFFIGSIATVINTVTIFSGTYILANLSDMTLDRDLRFFI